MLVWLGYTKTNSSSLHYIRLFLLSSSYLSDRITGYTYHLLSAFVFFICLLSVLQLFDVNLLHLAIAPLLDP